MLGAASAQSPLREEQGPFRQYAHSLPPPSSHLALLLFQQLANGMSIILLHPWPQASPLPTFQEAGESPQTLLARQG